MDSFELNKIAGAVLGTCLFLLSINMLSGAIFHAKKPEKPGYEVAAAEPAAAGGAAQAAVGPVDPIEVRLASASAEKGANAAKKCIACHDLSKGGPNKVGPNLWNIVGAPHAHIAGFAYSTPMKAKSAEPWDYEDINHFIASPRTYLPGTKMSFAGIARPSERADIIAYLRSLSDNPAPLP